MMPLEMTDSGNPTAEQEDLAVVQALVPLGLRISLADAYDRFGWEPPADGEACLAAPVQAPASGATDADGKPKPSPAPAAQAAAAPTPGPKTTDEAEVSTMPAQETEDHPIGAGADPKAIAQIASPQMPDPQVQAGSFWSAAGAAIRAMLPLGKKPAQTSSLPSPGNPGPAFGYSLANDAAPKLPESFQDKAVEQYDAARREDLAHAAAQIAALLQIDDPEHFKTKADQLLAKMDQITGNTLLAPTAADALEKVVGTSYANGLQPSRALANGDMEGHPFHGNQYVEISDEHWSGSPKEMREKARSVMRGFTSAKNPEIGDVQFTRKGRIKTLNRKKTSHEFQSVRALPQLVERGNVESELDRYGRPSVVAIHKIRHGLKIGDTPYKATVVVREVKTGATTPNQGQFYVHHIQIEEKKADSRSSSPSLSGQTKSPASHKKTTP